MATVFKRGDTPSGKKAKWRTRWKNAETGKWRIVSVVGGKIVGEDFQIGNVAVVLVDVSEQVSQWTP